MGDDQSLAILHLCTENLNVCVREAVYEYFEEKYDECRQKVKNETEKDKVYKKGMVAFQKDLRDVTKDKDKLESETQNLYVKLDTKCSYLAELLEQITRLQITLLSKIRKSGENTFEVSSPDVKEFCGKVLLLCCKTIFHNIEDYHQIYTRKNQQRFNEFCDSNINTVLNSYTKDAYTTFFKTPKKTSIDEAIFASTLDGAVPEDDRVIPDLKSQPTPYKPYKEEVREVLVDGEPLEKNNEQDDEAKVQLKELYDDSEDELLTQMG
tara:strand:+ start:3448 stop:4245 length:798 start_codon:yes stop_codon:yes gene_type:complete